MNLIWASVLLHSNELVILGLFFSGVIYINMQKKRIVQLHERSLEEIGRLQVLHCVKDIREANLDKNLDEGNSSVGDRNYIVTLLGSEVAVPGTEKKVIKHRKKMQLRSV